MSLPSALEQRLTWIDAEVRRPHNRLLLACLGPWDGEETQTVVDTVLRRGGVDWAGLIEAAIRHGVSPIVAEHVSRSAALDPLPEDVGRCLQRIREGNERRSAIMLRETGRIVAALEDAGIRSMVLKGAALAASAYPSPGLRNFADLDILVAPENLRPAEQVMDRLGYPPDRDVIPTSLTHTCIGTCDEDILSATLAPEFVPEHSPVRIEKYRHQVVVELHRGLMRTLDGEWKEMELAPFWLSVRRFDITDHRTAPMLGPEAMLVHLAVHAEEHAFGRLIFPVDVAFVLQRYGVGIQWDGVVGLAAAYNASALVYRLLDLSRTVCGTSVPERALASLLAACPDRPFPLSVGAILRSESAVGTEPRFRRLLLAGSPWQKLQAVVRIVAQPADAMREIYGVRSTAAVGLCYLVRPFHLAGRAVRLLLRNLSAGKP